MMRAFLAATAIFAVFFLPRLNGAPVAPSDPLVGTTDNSGKVIIHVYTADGADPISVPLDTDYGVMLFRARAGSARFLLAERPNSSAREFTNYADFLAALSKLPRASVLHIYDRCLVPRFSDFYPVHQELYEKFRADCRKRSLKIAPNSKITCTCAQHG